MANAGQTEASTLENRDENTGVIYTQPVDTINGSFTFPRQWPLNFRETSLINITWTTQYNGANLYYYQRGKAAVSTQIATNLATNWYQWQVKAEETNLTEPFVFRIVNARGTDDEQRLGGFWSTSFYILRDAVPTSTPTITPPSSIMVSSLPSPTIYTSSKATVISNTSTSSLSTAPTTSQFPSGNIIQATGDNNQGLSTGAITGVAVASVIIAGLLALISYCYGKRKNRKRRATNRTPAEQPAPAYWDQCVPAQEMWCPPVGQHESKVVHEMASVWQ